MKQLIGIGSLFSVLFLFSCIHDSKSTLDYSKLNYDSSRLTILKWDTLNWKFPNNSDPLPLSQIDLHLIDSLLRQAVDSFNEKQKIKINELITMLNNTVTDPDLFLLDIGRFKIEYIPYHDVNGHDIIVIDCFCDGSNQSKKYEEVWGKNRNYCHFELTVDLKQLKSSEVSVRHNFGLIKKLHTTWGFLLCWLKNINSSTYRLSSSVRAERINLNNRI